MLDFYEHRLKRFNVAKVIYGTIIILVVILAMEDHPPSPAGVVGTILFSAFGVALAELYSDFIGTRIREQRALTLSERMHVLRHTSTVLIGGLVPLPYFILAWLGILSEDLAFFLARWTLVAVLLFYGWVASRLSGYNLKWSVAFSFGACTIGIFVVLFKEAAGH